MFWLLTACFITEDDREEVFDNDNDGYFHPDFEEAGVLTDCNDNNEDIYPGAPENCEDEVDSDCDGLTCPEQISRDLLGEEPTFWGAPDDHLLARLAVVNVDPSDATPELILSAPGADDGLGAIYLLDSPAADLASATKLRVADLEPTLATDDDLLLALSEGMLQVGGAGDVDGDGDDELFLSNMSFDLPTTYVIDDWTGGMPEITAVFRGQPQVNDKIYELEEFALSTGVVVLDDPDGDGFNNMLVMGPLDGDSGRAYLLSQPVTESRDFSNPDESVRAWFVGEINENLFGGGSQTGFDFNCDGDKDILLTAPGYNLLDGEGEFILEEIGAVYGFDASSKGTINADDADMKLFGSYSESHIEWAADLGDTNNDGCSDLGVFFHAGAGDLAVFLGSSDPVNTLAGVNYSADGLLKLFGDDGGTPTEEFGYGTIGDMDIDGDGYGDIMLGAPSEGALNPANGVVSAGAAYFYFGPISGVSSPEHARGHWLGGLNEGRLGTPNVADIDADGTFDLLLSAPGASLGTDSDEGAVYVLYDAFQELL